jgi:hypothetical protein
LQYVFAVLLGIIPGCIGSFAVVSMYLHGAIRFGALVAALIAAFGDEAFVMFALFPLTTLKLTAIIAVLGVMVGIMVDKLKIKQLIPVDFTTHLKIHAPDHNHAFIPFNAIIPQLKRITFPRFILICGALPVIINILSGGFMHDPSQGAWYTNWEQLLFLIITLAGLFILIMVSDHFLEEHLWQHVIKKHLLKIALWTFGALILIHYLGQLVDINRLVHQYPLYALFLALIIGVIPESGPHLVFVTLFAQGLIPFSVLLASSIVQDGHGALPLFAESKKVFFLVKGINVLVGLVVGLLGIFWGF